MQMVYQLAVRNKLPVSFKIGEEGRAWAGLVLNRQNDYLSLRKLCGTYYVRKMGITEKNMNASLIFLEEAFNKHIL